MNFAPSILVFADDLTGAAEIAAIGVEHGLKTELATAIPQNSDAGLLVLDTDTRPLSAPAAAARIHAMLATLPRTANLFKKTDSVLRGQILSELRAIQKLLELPASLLVPQNPSKGRVIIGGRYLIDGVPLDQTSFRNDPEYPRLTSDVLSLLTGSDIPADVRVADPDLAATPVGGIISGITIGNAASAADMRQWASFGLHPGRLLAGGADLFHAFLEQLGFTSKPSPPVIISQEKTLIVCGSTTDYSRSLVDRWHAEGLPVCPLPESIVESLCVETSYAETWAQAARTQLLGPKARAILAIRHPITPNRAVAYRRCMAETVRRLVTTTVPSTAEDFTLIVEGGATAAAIAQALAWTDFEVIGNLSPGVVAMRPLAMGGRLRMVLKPGSYPWPAGFPEARGLA